MKLKRAGLPRRSQLVLSSVARVLRDGAADYPTAARLDLDGACYYDTATIAEMAGLGSGTVTGFGREVRSRVAVKRMLDWLHARGLAGKIVTPVTAVWVWWPSEGTCDLDFAATTVECDPSWCRRGERGCWRCQMWGLQNLGATPDWERMPL